MKPKYRWTRWTTCLLASLMIACGMEGRTPEGRTIPPLRVKADAPKGRDPCTGLYWEEQNGDAAVRYRVADGALHIDYDSALFDNTVFGDGFYDYLSNQNNYVWVLSNVLWSRRDGELRWLEGDFVAEVEVRQFDGEGSFFLSLDLDAITDDAHTDGIVRTSIHQSGWVQPSFYDPRGRYTAVVDGYAASRSPVTLRIERRTLPDGTVRILSETRDPQTPAGAEGMRLEREVFGLLATGPLSLDLQSHGAKLIEGDYRSHIAVESVRVTGDTTNVVEEFDHECIRWDMGCASVP